MYIMYDIYTKFAENPGSHFPVNPWIKVLLRIGEFSSNK